LLKKARTTPRRKDDGLAIETPVYDQFFDGEDPTTAFTKDDLNMMRNSLSPAAPPKETKMTPLSQHKSFQPVQSRQQSTPQQKTILGLKKQ